MTPEAMVAALAQVTILCPDYEAEVAALRDNLPIPRTEAECPKCDGTGAVAKYPELRVPCSGPHNVAVPPGWIHSGCCDGSKMREVEPRVAMAVMLETWPTGSGIRRVYISDNNTWSWKPFGIVPRWNPSFGTATEAVLAAKMKEEGLEVTDAVD